MKQHSAVSRRILFAAVAGLAATGLAAQGVSARPSETDLDCVMSARVHFAAPVSVTPSSTTYATRQPGNIACDGVYRGVEGHFTGRFTMSGTLSESTCASSRLDGLVLLDAKGPDGLRVRHTMPHSGARAGTAATATGGDDELRSAVVATVSRFGDEDCVRKAVTGGDIAGSVRLTSRG